MTWENGPAPAFGGAVQAFDVGFLRHAVLDDLFGLTEAELVVSYAESSFADGVRRTVRMQLYQDAQPVGEQWSAEIGAPVPE